MQTKTKWITTLATLCAVLVVAIVSMGIVWAAASQQVRTSVNITYTVSGNVICDVSANKYFGSDTPTAFSGGTAGVLSFNAPDASTVGTLTIADTTLTTTNDYVIYEYVFTNNNADAAMNVALATGSATNLTFYVIAPTTTRLTNIYTGFDPSTTWSTGNSIAATDIAAGATAYAYVAAKVTDLNQAATFSGYFTWTINAGAAA